MNFKKHLDIKEGSHAFLGASKYHWINYDEKRLVEAYNNNKAAEKGTELHAFAAQCIRLNQKLQKSKKTLNQYVNDAIGFKMTPEQVLYYSKNCFGTADAICFRDDILRIHDLKTGVISMGHMEQLEIYAALFCLEYKFKPSTISIILRLYQNDNFIEYEPHSEEIEDIMNKIIYFDSIIEDLSEEV